MDDGDLEWEDVEGTMDEDATPTTTETTIATRVLLI
jgi:hypothetical protein